MTKKIFLLGVCLLALAFNAFSQETLMAKKDALMTKDVTAEEAAQTALTVGAAMPSFNLNDAKGNSVSSAELKKTRQSRRRFLSRRVVSFLQSLFAEFAEKSNAN